jgi:MbtH protein
VLLSHFLPHRFSTTPYCAKLPVRSTLGGQPLLLSLASARVVSAKERPMPDNDTEDLTVYRVVVNHEEQYSIWPRTRENPPGWNDAGKQGLKAECLAYIREVWTDMRPLSLRRRMAEAEAQRDVRGEDAGRDR